MPLNTFQILGLSVVVLLFAITVSYGLRGRTPVRATLVWVAIWLFAAVSLIWPKLTEVIARTIGIRRGADLVFYGNVLLTLAGLFWVYLKQRRIDRQITLLVRQLAVDRPSQPVSPSLRGDDETDV